MLARGHYLAPALYEAGFVSSAHTDADIDHLVRVASVVDANDLIASQFAANVEWYGDDVPWLLLVG